MKCLFLDDERFPDEVFWISYKHYKDMDFTIVRTALDFKFAIEQENGFQTKHPIYDYIIGLFK